MAKHIDTTHVRNVGEFYSQHYLDAVLPEDLQPTLERWTQREDEGGAKVPERRLAALAEPYFRAMAEHQATGDAGRRVEIAAGFHARVIEALGYERAPQAVVLPGERELPLAVALSLQGKPYLWIGEAGFPESDDDADPLGMAPLRVGGDEGGAEEEAAVPWRELLDGPVLRQEHAPRWVLLLAGPDAFLVDRDKWAQGQYLHFSIGAMLGQRKPAALRALAGLLHREVLLPEGGRSLLDEIDEKSHKHAFAVSTDLKHGVQRAIELIGNEVVWYKSEVSHEKLFERPELAKELSRECITYLYRLLFLFYVEARGGEVGVVPMKAEAYRLGLSLESLRDLELVPLSTERARNGFFIHHSLTKLFEVVHLGWPIKRQRDLKAQFADSVDLTVSPQRSPLFDKARTPLLSSVKLRNHVLQEVIRLLSLSKEGKRAGAGARQRGRISYAQLGINQLGAVYEGLLSYTGFFTQEDTFEIRNPKEKDEDARVYYVGKSRIEDYREDEFRKTKTGKKIMYPSRTFLFRLAGRDREKSASYYTPEVLTKCLTKYTLKERLGVMGEPGALTADEILELTVCEPAMGSGAFLNEAVGQLAHAYLERKQAERGEQIPAEEYQREWARVRYHFVVHNCYGVDLNPLAAELGKVSLWLGVLQPGVQAPYLDLRLRVGNSLIGARREVYSADDLMRKPNKKTGAVNWLGKAPERVKPGEERPAGSVYQFLVPDEGMSPYEKDKVVAGLCPGEIEALKKWRKEMKQPFTAMEVKRLQGICERVDALWEEHRRVREGVLGQVQQPIVMWGQPALKPTDSRPTRWKTAEECEVATRELWKRSSPGLKLRAVMDVWCRLWMWPVERATELPSRDAWLTHVDNLLEVGPSAEETKTLEARFLHWELEFPEVFAERKGFDIILGNPPWIRMEWKESETLEHLDPSLYIHEKSAKQASDQRTLILKDTRSLSVYLTDFSVSYGIQSYVGSPINYPPLKGAQPNLYKCFLVLAWRTGATEGSFGLFHQTGILDDPGGRELREHLYHRASLIVRFPNTLRLFPIGDKRFYAMSIGKCNSRSQVDFISFSNIMHPNAIQGSEEHDGLGQVPAIKNQHDQWDVRPHKSRQVHVNRDSLKLLARIYDPPGTLPEQARLPVIHSREMLSILRRLGETRQRLSDKSGQYSVSVCFDETGRQRDGTIKRKTVRPTSISDWIISGPHFYIGTPFNKTPNEDCRTKADYSTIDLTRISPDFLPRTNYIPKDRGQYIDSIPKWNSNLITKSYRHIHREMAAPSGERTLIPCIIPPGPTHIHTVLGISFSSHELLLNLAGISHSIVADFLIKSTGSGHINKSLSELLPLMEAKWSSRAHDRVLRLNCLNVHYADLWNECLPPTLLPSANPDPRTTGWESAPRTWTWDAPLRTPYARRQALVELDALAALSLGMTLDELLLIYRVQFPVLRQYENETFYDRRGKIVFTVNRGLSGVGLTRDEWTQIKDAKQGDPLPEWAKDAGGPFLPPFDRCDREADMAQAYAYFQRLLP